MKSFYSLAGRFGLLCLLLLSGLSLSAQTDIEFCVDYSSVSGQTGFAAQQILFGTNDFRPLANTGGDIWCGTFDLPAGDVQYRFFYAAAAGIGGPENLAGSTCTGDVGGTTTRSYTVVEGQAETVTSAWEVCEDPCIDDTEGPTFAQPNFLNVTVSTSQRDDACPGNQFLQEFATENRLVMDIAFFAAQELGNTGITAEQFYAFFADNCTADPMLAVRFTSVTSTIRPDGSDSVTVIGQLVDEAGNLSVVDTATVIFIDDTDPEALCQDVTVQLDENGMASFAALETITEFTGELDADDPTFNRAFGSGGGCTLSGFGDDVTFETLSFSIDAADMYTFSMAESADYDGFFALYEGGFDPADACSNFLQSADDEGPNGNDPDLVIQLDLVPGEYTLVTTTFGNGQFGEYSVSISSEAGGNVLELGDGLPLSNLDGGSTDNCGAVTLSADITDFTCDDIGDVVVTLTATDGSMNTATCMATVTVENNNAPVVVANDQVVVLSDGATSVTLTEEDVLTATDACGGEVTVEFDRELTFTGADIGEVIVTVTATAANGVQTMTTFTVVVTFDQPNLACISEINLTLNDECQGLLIPEMLLTGNTGLLSSFQFDITVNDNNPSNGPVVDGCGRFQYSISPASLGDEPVIGFTGAFAPENWTLDAFFVDGFPISAPTIGVSEFSDPETLSLQTLGDNSGVDLVAFAGIVFGETGTVNLSYDYNGVDVGLGLGFDDAIVLTSFEGNIIETLLDQDMADSGELNFDVAPGNALEITIIDDGFTPAFGADPTAPSVLEITDFSFAPPVSPRTLDFETCWGWVNAEDKTPPAVVITPDDVELLCVDVDDNTLTTLASTVSKCYRVNSDDGSTVPGSMVPTLRNRLRAGGSTPLVPTFTDGCTEFINVCVNDVLVYDDEDPACNDVVLTRTFTATEIAVCPSAAGEENPSVTASYVITFVRPTLDSLNSDNVQDVVNYEQCGVANPTRADYPAPRAGDYPFLEVAGRTFNLSGGNAVCNIGVTYADGEPIVTCPFTYKFVRTYTVIDWCDPSDVRTFSQVVKVGDTTAPTFTGPTQDRDFDGVIDDDLIYMTNAGNICAAYIRLDAGISAVDNCSDDVTITASIYPGGDLTATPIGAFDVDPTDNNAEVTSAIPVGCHLLRYTFTDDCGNSDFADYPFCVEDGTAPVAICEDGLNISISSGSAAGGASTGIAILTPSMIDGGSYDDCSGVTLSIACVNGDNINTEPYDQELVLTCADLGIKRVGLRVEDAEGNVNYCWLDVLVEDKNAPTCIAPGPVNISCIVAKATLPADIMEATEAELDATFRSATGVDNCGVTITSTIDGDINNCGVGSFTRVFTATDGEGFTNTNNCRQRITVYGVHDYRLTFPTDEEEGCAVIPVYDGIDADEYACDLITTDVKVDTLRTQLAGDECFKLRVTYDIINWCEYGSLGQPYLIPRDGDGIRNPATQLLYLNVNPGTDESSTSDDMAFLSRFADRNYNPGAPQNDQLLDDGDDMDGTDDDNGNDNIDNDAYGADASRGHFRYIQFIKISDDVAPVITSVAPADCFAGTSATCTAEVELTFTATDECSEASVQLELDADYNAAAGFVRTSVVNATHDGAGNFTINLSDIPVGNHAIRVRASDGCGNADVEIIEFCVTGDKAPTPICIQTLTVTLMPNGQGGGMAAIWASDFIASDVEDCFGNVIDKYSIYTEEEAGVAGFAPAAGRLGIDLTCDDFGNDVPVRVYAIDNNGSADYCSVIVEVQAFQDGLCIGSGGNLAGNIATQDDDMMEGVEVSLTGENNMDEMVVTAANGAYTFTNLPLGVDYTIQPDYNVGVDLAEVKVSDVVKIGSVILGTSSFDNGYDFIAGDVDMDGSLSIFDMVAIQRVILGLDQTFATGETWRFVTEEHNLTTSNWASSFPEVYNANDLAGIQSGVDFVAIQMGNVIREAGRSALNLETEDASLEAGQTHTMILTAGNMLGFQGTIELAAGLELIDVTYEGEGGLNLNAAAQGVIGVAMREATSLTLEVRATEAGQLSELVSLTDALVLTEGVDLNGASTGLGLAFNGSSIAPAVSALLQNTPNPVVESTTIRFELAVAGAATLSVQDAAGRVVMVRQLDAVAGMNRVDLTAADLGAAGVLTYTLTADDFSATKKMVVVR